MAITEDSVIKIVKMYIEELEKNGIIRSIESQGYECPVICSPEELMGELK